MRTRFASALLLSLTLASTGVMAQGHDRDRNDHYRSQEHGQRDNRGYDRERHDRDRRNDPRHDYRNDRVQYGAHRFHRGDRLPPGYRDRAYVVNRWHDHHLQRPPRGHEWVQIGGDYVLVAIATGVIASIILSH